MADFFANSLGAPWPLAYLLAALIQCGLILGLIAGGVLFFIWLERKISGRIQDRLGPTRVGGKFGWLQSLGRRHQVDRQRGSGSQGCGPGACSASHPTSVSPPVTRHFWHCPSPMAGSRLTSILRVFFILAVLGLEVFGVILAGYASGSKWSLFGAMREAAQVVSYEVPLGICVVIPVLLCGTMNLTTIGNMQAGWFTNWLIFHDPFTFAVFWVYFTCALASVNRAPFDLAEAESELVAGFLTEYSGLRWSYFFMAEYGSMLLVSGLAAILFFGGWNGPIPIFHMLGMGL